MPDDAIYVEVPATGTKRARAATGVCKVCGIDLDDGRASYCIDHKPEKSVTTARKTSSKKGLTKDVQDGTAAFAGKILYIVTLMFAWSVLNRNGIPDPTGDYQDTMAMTADEANIISRPLARMFLSTEPGRRIAPKIVENEDVLDAAFAAWDWYKRVQETVQELAKQYGTTPAPANPQPAPTSRRRRSQTHGQTSQSASADRPASTNGSGPSEPVYVPPDFGSQYDI